MGTVDTVLKHVVRILFKIPYVRHQAELNFREPSDDLFGSLVRYIMNLKNRFGSECAADELDVQPGEVFLEVGFGSGWALRRVLSRDPASIIGYELSESMFNEVSTAADLQDARLNLYLSDCLNMSEVLDNSVDKMLIANVVYFLQPLTAYAEEFYRVLARDGKLACVLKLKTVSRFDPEIFVNTEEGRIVAAFEQVGFMATVEGFSYDNEPAKNEFSLLVCTKE